MYNSNGANTAINTYTTISNMALTSTISITF